ncbi:MAG TPA: hypothetical protein VKS60_16795 [Stellaceae bacterium]|nr:hypothetical protein [Stellaceae bacterium]
MAVAIKNDADSESGDLNAIRSDIARLKSDLASLMHGLGRDAAGPVPRARKAIGDLGDEALRIADTLTAQGGRAAKAIGRQVGEQPVVSLLLAFAAGFLGSRLLPR